MSTLKQLRDRVREKVDEDTATFWTDSTINNAINESYRFYWAFISLLREWYFSTSDNIDFDANSAGLYDLPSDFLRARLVSRLIANQKIPLKYFERQDNTLNTILANSTYNLPTYRFRGAHILFEPAPDFIEVDAVELEYEKKCTALSADGSTIDSAFPDLGEDCIVLRSVVKCKGIEEMVQGGGVDTDPFIKDLLSTEQILKEAFSDRSVARTYVEQFGQDDNDSIQNFL